MWLPPSGYTRSRLRAYAPSLSSCQTPVRVHKTSFTTPYVEIANLFASPRWTFLHRLGRFLPLLCKSACCHGLDRSNNDSPLIIQYIQVYAEEHGISSSIGFYLLAIVNAASVFGRVSANFVADYFGNINLMFIMCTSAGVLSFSVFGAGSAAGSIVVSIFFGFFAGGYVSLIGPALMSTASHPSENGIRSGLGECRLIISRIVLICSGFFAISFAALTGTPITGALLDRYGFYAPITWSGVTILTGGACYAAAIHYQRKEKGTWKV